MRNKLLTLALFSCFIQYSFSQGLLFNHLTVENGLSQATVYAAYQDELNRMWFATRDGLNLYDGNKIETFRPTANDTTGLWGSNIQYVCGDQKGHVYIQCMAGLAVYDLKALKMHALLKKKVDCITYGKDRLWVIEDRDLKYLDTTSFTLNPYAKIGFNDIICIKESNNGEVYIGTNSKGLYIVGKNRKIEPILSDVSVACIYVDKFANCWVGTVRDGLYRINAQREITHYKNDPNNPKSLSNNYVRTICLDNLGDYWVGTFKGVDRLNISTGEFTNFDHSIDDPYSIGNSSVRCITNDRQGTLWIGTFFGGVDILNPEYSFKQYYRVKGDKNGLSGSVVGHIAEDKENNLWVCTENGGLNYFDRKKNLFKSYTHSPNDPNSISSNNIKSIYLDEKRNCLWLGTHMGGLNRYDLNARTFQRIKIGDNLLNNDYVRCIAPYKDKLYLGTHNSIVEYNPQTKQWGPLLDNKKQKLVNLQIWDLIIDSKEQLWFSTAYGMYRYDLKKEKLTRYAHNPANTKSFGTYFSNTFFEDNRGNMWIGSAGSGLSLYHPETDDFTHFHTQNSQLIDDYVLDISQSAKGYLLIATNKGISRFDIKNKAFTNYNNKNYFPFASLNESSLFVTKENEIIVCSLNGLVILNEKDLDLKPQKYDINLTNLYVNNILVKPNDENEILQQALPYTKEITLNHNHSVFSVEFALTNYIKSIQPNVYYKLEGFDEKWVEANERRIITYTNLEAGNYTLLVRTTPNSSSDETVTETTLNISILPPIYKTWYAYLLYIIALTTIIYAILSNYQSRVHLKTSLSYAEREQKRIEELSQAKLKFFTNVSHEFRTPITLMISQLELILQNGTIQQAVYHRLLQVLKNAEKMKVLINELLDFRKQEQGFMKLKVSEHNMIVFLNAIFIPFIDYAKSKQITYTFSHQEEDINVWFDSKQMEKVFYNLLSNAFKFTPAGKEISIAIERKDTTVIITVADTGIGIEDKSIDKIFNPFFQEDTNIQNASSNLGSGIGLALSKGIIEAHKGYIAVQSKPGVGSALTVTLLRGNTHFDEAEIVKPENHESDTMPESSIIEPGFIDEIKESQQKISSQETSILLVEDNSELLQTLAELFSPIYIVHTASDGKKGYEKTLELQPDIVLTDVMMPIMSGTEMCRKIKTNVNTCHIPVVLLTARSTVEHTIEGLQTGADDYIAKPFNAKILIIRCNNLVNGRKTLQAQFLRKPDANPQMLAANSYDQELLEKAMAIIEKNIDNEHFDIEMFAQEMCLGRTNLFTKIKGLTGQTPNDFITSIRLKKSLVLLLEEPNTSISAISTKLGFSDTPYFIKRFKKVYGMTPLQYRKNGRNDPAQ